MTRKFNRRTTMKAGAAAIGTTMLVGGAAAGTESDGATLYAARDVPIGTVSVDRSGRDLTVTYATDGSEWLLTAAHLHVATDVDGIPTNRGGNPRIGHFARAREPDAATGAIEIEDIAVEDEAERVAIAAHAEVQRAERTEGAWAGSESITDRGNWARYFEYELAEPEPGIRGTIVQANGEPGTDDRLVFLGPRGVDEPEFGSIYTDEEGTFSTQVAEAGTYSLGYYQRERWNVDTPERDGSPDVYTLGPVDVGRGVTDLGRIELPDAHVLDVRVVDEDGSPVADAPVNFYDQGSWGISRRHTTNADGYFQYDGLDETGIELLGEVRVHVWEPGTDPEPGTHAAERRIDLDGPRTEEIVLDGSGDDPGGPLEISGTIYEPTGDPATGDRVSIRGPRHSNEADASSYRAATDDSGHFSTDVEDPGSYVLGYIQQQEADPASPERDGTPDVYHLGPVDVDGAVDLGTVDLPEAHVLDVRVVDANGNPIEGAPVSVWSCTDDFSSCWGSAPVETNADGYFQYAGFEETGAELIEHVMVRVWHPDVDDPGYGNVAEERELGLVASRTEEFVLDG